MADKCKRCGECCKSGPPALHREDVFIYKEGMIKKSDLITYRKGELVYDNVKDVLVCLEQEIVKIKSKTDKKECLFLNNFDCSIYFVRPRECKVFECWNIKPFLEYYLKNRATRLDFIPVSSALGETIVEHEKRCSVETLLDLVEDFEKTKDQNVLKQIHIILDQDRFFRKYLIEAGADQQELDFVFGRDLTHLVPPNIISLIDF